jgi:hypothetical protein
MLDEEIPSSSQATTSPAKNYVELVGPAHQPQAEPKPRQIDARGVKNRKVAVLVAHGMGSQVPFETLQLVANRLRPYAVPLPGAWMDVGVQLVTLGMTQLPRAEMTVRDQHGLHVDVHFYEAYWAPLTEGKVTARDGMWFLFMGGLRGLWGSLMSWRFERWMFRDWQRFPFKSLGLVLAFVLALAVLTSFFVMNVVIVALTVGQAQSPAQFLPLVTADFLPYELGTFALLGLGIGMPMVFRRILAALGWPARLGRWMRWPSRLLVFLTIGITIRTGWKICVAEFEFLRSPQPPPAPAAHIGLMVALSLGLAIVIAYAGRWFLREYVGDVAAYVSSYSLSKFDELRNSIQKASLGVFQPVYGEESQESKVRRAAAREAKTHPEPEIQFEYEEIVVLGHSLGSVVAYDTIDALFNLPSGSTALDISRRTKAFLTFGSPLDKTAFIFRLQRPRQNEIREVLAAAKQPMIQDYAFRPKRWVNLYSPDDWISGSLEFYDPDGVPDPVTGILAPEHTPDPDKRVRNIEDLDAYIPLAAHVFYWTTDTFTRELYEAVVS